jgi:hypothetical protein
MRLPSPNIGSPTSFPALGAALSRILQPIVNQVNSLSDGEAAATNNAASGPPAVGTTAAYAVSDFIRNNAPAELGTAGSKYVIFGWICVAAGTPGTWKQCRFLTGN